MTRSTILAGLVSVAALAGCSRSGYPWAADAARAPEAALLWRDATRDRLPADSPRGRDNAIDRGPTCPRLVPGNLLTLAQQDLEAMTAGGWQNVQSPSAVAAKVTPASAYSGCASLEITVVDAINFVQLYAMGTVDKNGSFDAQPGTTYLWTAGVQSLQPQRQARAALDLFDASWTTEHRTGTEVSLSSTWAQPWLAFTTKADTRYVQMYIQIHETNWQTLPVGDKYRIDFGVFRQGQEVPTPDCQCPSGG